MNIILLERPEVQVDTVTLTDRRATHLVKVLGISPGDTVRIGILDGPQGMGTVTEISKRYPFQVTLTVQFVEEVDEDREEKPFIDLLLALPRPIMLRRIFSQAAALGVGNIFITHAQRVEKSFWNASLLNEAEYRPHLLQGLEQAIDTRVPKVHIHGRFKPFIEDILPNKIANYSHLLIAHPDSSSPLRDVIVDVPGKILVAIGPEGGWIDYELDRFAKCGFTAFSLGKRILKVDTAVVAIHARLSERRDFLRLDSGNF
jgi:16S rRNA (uracil1498-N3)-methyltransferase